jgi:hypothetical protein
MRHAEKQLAAQAQASCERMVRDWKAASPKKDVGASVTPERASNKALEGQRRAAGPRAPDACSLTRHRLAPTRQPRARTDVDHHDGDHPRKIRPITLRRRPAPDEPTSQKPIEGPPRDATDPSPEIAQISGLERQERLVLRK